MKTITIQGLEFDINQPYAAGHTVTEAEAKALNQVRAENIRNNTARLIASAKSEHGDELPPHIQDELRARVAEYDASYEFNLSNAGTGRTLDPVERKALEIARTAVREQAKREGRKILKEGAERTTDSDITREEFQAKVAEVAELPKVIKLAKKRVKEDEELGALNEEAA